MYKIQFLLVLLLSGQVTVYGQSTAKRQVPIARNGKKNVAQTKVLQSGPMVGYSDMREVKLWVQTNQPAHVQIRYQEDKSPADGKPPASYVTNEVYTNRQTAFTAHLLADQVEPGKKYTYELLIEGQKVSLPYPTQFQTQNLWQWRTDPPTFQFGVGSCTYVNEARFDRPGTPYGGGYEIFTALAAKSPISC
ncbi:MAG: alkaline phosphatase family protein, partial [Cytophagaceae bacterium]